MLVSKLHLPTMRALAYARATRPDYLEAVTVNVDTEETADLAREWEDRQIPVALKVIDSPYREITKPVLDYVAPDPQGRRRAPSSPSSFPSTSSATGGSTCCTTRARCGSRAGCCSRPA